MLLVLDGIEGWSYKPVQNVQLIQGAPCMTVEMDSYFPPIGFSNFSIYSKGSKKIRAMRI